MDHALLVSSILIIIRILVPFTLLRWPIGGVVISSLADYLDHPILQYFGWGLYGNGNYQQVDKLLDTWYLFFLFLIVWRWANPLARKVGIRLFFWRLVGVITFEITGLIHMLVLTPNIFENFYIIWAVILKWFSRWELTRKRLIIIILIAAIPKILQELSMHWLYPNTGMITIIRLHIIPGFSRLLK